MSKTPIDPYQYWWPLRRDIQRIVDAQLEAYFMSPAKTERQRKFMAAEHERVAEGKAPRGTKGMTQKQREDFMHRSKGSKKK